MYTAEAVLGAVQMYTTVFSHFHCDIVRSASLILIRMHNLRHNRQHFSDKSNIYILTYEINGMEPARPIVQCPVFSATWQTEHGQQKSIYFLRLN